MRRLKHSKYKNTGFLFELLVRQVTSDIVGNKKSVAEGILKKYFSPKADLGKELKLYQMLLSEKYNSEVKGTSFIEAVLASHSKLSRKVLREQKYNLVKDIKDNYPINDFLRAPISDYKILASIYKLFENNHMDADFDPSDLHRCRETLLEHVTGPKKESKKAKDMKVLSEYKDQEKELQLLSYKILVDKFNEKYGSKLCSRQKNLLKEYIHNISNDNSLREYVRKEVPWIKKQLRELVAGIDDEVTKIKLSEIQSQMSRIKNSKSVREKHITALLLAYELIQEIRRVTDVHAEKCKNG